MQPHEVGGGLSCFPPGQLLTLNACSFLSVLRGRNPSHSCAPATPEEGEDLQNSSKNNVGFFSPPRKSSYAVPKVSSQTPLSNTPGGISLRFGLPMKCNRKQSTSAQGDSVKLGRRCRTTVQNEQFWRSWGIGWECCRPSPTTALVLQGKAPPEELMEFCLS